MGGKIGMARDAVLDGLSAAQRDAILATEGPVLLIAGPGAGKTLTVVRRTIHLLMSGLAEPEQIVLCTFTEKAAFELQERLRGAAAAASYPGDLSGALVGTIHGLCNRFIERYRHLTPLGNGYEVLDDLTRQLFILDHFRTIFGDDDAEGKILGRWRSRWTAISEAVKYFDKITEELIDPEDLSSSTDAFTRAIGQAFVAYRDLLLETNRTDFAHLQRYFLDVLRSSTAGDEVRSGVRYVMVDEYQDTNRIQEELVTELARGTGNLCVVGDEDQSLYRFRGATVRNILEFPTKFAGCRVIKLTTNYRSHRGIVERYDAFMASGDWSNPSGAPFRYDKHIEADPDGEFADYPSVISLWGMDPRDEGERFANLVRFLKDQQVISDFSQVALLLRSVKLQHSGHYLDALDRSGIPYFCPRAGGFFENEEVAAAVACFAAIFGWHGDDRGSLAGAALPALARYVDEATAKVAQDFGGTSELAVRLRGFISEIETMREGETLDRRPADYLFELLGVEPFLTWMKSDQRARRLAVLSTLVNTFQRYYHFTVVSHAGLRRLRLSLFNSFFRLLHSGGINEFEDPDEPFPPGHVQVMTIHQAKGLEFPVVVVGSLTSLGSSAKEIDRVLGAYYARPLYEPEQRITHFDRMRLHYVAFSRPEKLLVLTAAGQPKAMFDPIWEGLEQWPKVERELLAAQEWEARARETPKRRYSFTGDLRVYETCPRQYQMFRRLDFTPSRSSVIFFGLLVHQTIEDVHRAAMLGSEQIDDEHIEEWLDVNYRNLALKDVRAIGDDAKKAALRQVLDYVRQNGEAISRVVEAEVDVSLEKDGYILNGAVDLLMSDGNSFDLLDFKSQRRPPESSDTVDTYYRQLCIYAHILEQRYGRRPDRLVLYWTGERSRESAWMEFEFRPEDVAEAVEHFDDIVGRIARSEYEVEQLPAASTCKECDFRAYCRADGTLR